MCVQVCSCWRMCVHVGACVCADMFVCVHVCSCGCIVHVGALSRVCTSVWKPDVSLRCFSQGFHFVFEEGLPLACSSLIG